MIGSIKATWSGNDAWNTKVQTLRVTVYGKRKQGQGETVLSFADVQVMRKTRSFGFEWVGPKDLKAVFEGIAGVTRLSCSVPEEMRQVYDNLGIKEKEINMPMNTQPVIRPKDSVTLFFPESFVSFRR